MSVIFQTLQNLNADEQAQEFFPQNSYGSMPADSQRWFSVNRLIYIVIGVFMVIIIGYGAVFAVIYLKRHISPPHGQALDDRIHSSSKSQDVVKYLKIESSESDQNAVSKTSYILPSDGQIEGKDLQMFENPQSLVIAKEPEHSVGKTFLEKTGQTLESSQQTATIPGSTADQKHKDVLDEQEQARRLEMQKLQARRKAAREKSARIEKIAGRLENALTKSDIEQAYVSKLFRELSRLKGADHPYVLELKAYALIRQENYAQAEKILLKVIYTDRKNVEAGINLAVIEFRTGRHQQAIERLKRLRLDFPENERVFKMLKKLK
ncbi:MAG: tetratricopeptide repeat protein [Desulfobacteraceae bacterium]|nr:tetratricopeptide repeat protein [Desulfobacteraceae bacterium]